MKALLPDGRLLGITDHAADRYIERVRPSCPGRRDAEREIQRLVQEHGVLVDEPPVWLGGWRDEDVSWVSPEHSVGYVVCGCVVFALAWVPGQPQVQLVTTIAQGTIPDSVRAAKTRQHRGRRRRRQNGTGRVYRAHRAQLRRQHDPDGYGR